jgi:hypothetical protein
MNGFRIVHLRRFAAGIQLHSTINVTAVEQFRAVRAPKFALAPGCVTTTVRLATSQMPIGDRSVGRSSRLIFT